MSVSAVSRRRQRAVHLHEVPAPDAPSRLWLVALGVVVGIGAFYHWLQSLGHVTPAVFTDELLFSELARSFAAGDLFQVRGEHVFFPAFLPALLQAPAWLVHSTPLAYAIAKGLNTLLMCLAALPAYWLARQLVRPAFALVVAAATLAGGGMVYHGYLTSEAAAYPLFLLAVAVSVRALAAPSRGRDLLAVAVLGLAVLTRAQFVVLPIAFALAVLLVGRPLRRHATALLALATGAMLGLAVGGPLLGFYAGAGELDYGVAETLRWSAWTAALLPFGAGILVVPGALLGIGFALRRGAPGERAFAALTALLLALMPLQAGLIGSGSAHKPLERYAFYVLPLLFLAFFVFAERGAGVRLHGGVALALAGVALVTPFASLTVDPYSFDSPTLSAVETLGRWTAHGDAAALFGAAGVLGALTAVALRRRPTLTALLSVALALLIGLGAYSGDRRMTHRTLEALAPNQPDWLERSGVHEADVLALPGGSLHRGWVLESWNRNVGRTFHLGDVPSDQLPYTEVGIRPDGRVAPVGQRLLRSNYLVVDDSGTQIELNARRIARPRAGLSLYRLSRPLQLGSVAFGLYSDRWAQSVLGYRVFRRGLAGGSYRITLSLPKGRAARTVDAEAGPVRRFATLRPGSRLTLRIPVSSGLPPELAVRVGRADLIEAETPRPRLVAARIEALDFLPKGSRK